VDIKVAQELMRHASCRTTLDVYTRAVDQQKREASLKVMELMLPRKRKNFNTLQRIASQTAVPQVYVRKGFVGGPDRDRTDDLFHAMEARSQLRHRPTLAEGLFLFWRSRWHSSMFGGNLSGI
jgi:glutaredoxin-related protein